MLGFHGSYISDLFFQSLGLIAYLIPLTYIFTGINIFRKKELLLLIENTFFIILFSLFGSLFFSFFYNNAFTLFINGNGGFVGSFLRFVLDRWAFVNLYRAPPEYDATVARSARKWFPYAALMHICFAMWMFTNPKIFGDKDSSLASSTVGSASVSTAETDDLQQEGISLGDNSLWGGGGR